MVATKVGSLSGPLPATAIIPALLITALLAVGAFVNPARAQVPKDGVEHPEMFAQRRAEFLSRLGSGVAVFHAKPVYNRNDDIDYPYRQDSDFYYLTGFEEPEAIAVLTADAGKGPKYTLFVQPRDPQQETWTGHRYGTEGALSVFKADEAYVIDSLPAVMPRILKGASRILYASAGDLEFAQQLSGWAGPRAPTAPEDEESEDAPPGDGGFASPLPIVHEMRLIKSPEEIDRVQRAVDITEAALRSSMRAATPGLYESELEALQYYVYRTSGSERYGFPSIVGSGPNSVTLHYEENNRQMKEGEVVVNDIGTEYAMYSADVTRTIPVNGRFSPEQRQIYQIIVDAQDAAMELMRPAHTIAESSQKAAQVVTEGLVKLGILKGGVEENLRSQAFSRFYMHGLSHWIGLDVHDAGDYFEPDGSPRKFQPGMILSNEPGIYIPDGTPGVDPKWYNIGVRLENDVLVTEEDAVDMTANIPRRIEDVEAEMAKPPLTIQTGKPGVPVLKLTETRQPRTGAGPAGRDGTGTGTAVDEAGRVPSTDQGKTKRP
jgi:Xaa-Pro aminopeptidase